MGSQIGEMEVEMGNRGSSGVGGWNRGGQRRIGEG